MYRERPPERQQSESIGFPDVQGAVLQLVRYPLATEDAQRSGHEPDDRLAGVRQSREESRPRCVGAHADTASAVAAVPRT